MKNNIIINIPHSSTKLPKFFLKKLLITEIELEEELKILTDLYTDKIVYKNKHNYLIAKYSRLYCDLERFKDDSMEIMAKKGMGSIYTKTTSGKKLINLDSDYKNKVINIYYDRYHNKLNEITKKILNEYSNAIIIDIHSFSEKLIDKLKILKKSELPDICIGIDYNHIEKSHLNVIMNEFKKNGYTININYPYKGTIIPYEFYTKKDERVKSYMIEINKRIYLNENDVINIKEFKKLKKVINNILSIIGAEK